MTDSLSTTRFISGFDGTPIAWRELGQGRPIVLLHGLFSDAATNWIKYGHAAAIAAAGRRVILPDLRAHGESGKPHDAQAYPPDVLAMDAEALIAALGLTDYDLGGYSLGARTVVRVLVRGIAPMPGRVVLSGMGLDGLIHTGGRAGFFRRVLTGIGTHPRGTPEFMAEAFLKTTGGDAKALLALLDSFVDTDAAAIGAIAAPVLVVGGEEDGDNGSMAELAEVLPDGRFVSVPGNHMSAVVRPELGTAMAEFLAA